MKEKISIFSRGTTITYLVFAFICLAIWIGLIAAMGVGLISMNYIFWSIFPFLMSVICFYEFLFAGEIVIDFKKQRIKYHVLLGFEIIMIPLIKKIPFKNIMSISVDNDPIIVQHNRIMFELTSGKRRFCSVYNVGTTKEIGKKKTEEIVKRLNELLKDKLAPVKNY